MSILSSHSSKINKYIFDFEKPKTYLALMQKVGDGGKYQRTMLHIFILNWFVTGIILLSNIFLFRNRLYDCEHQGILLQQQQCLQYVCSLPEDQWDNYQSTDHNEFENIATLYNFQCQDSVLVTFAATSAHLGAVLGFLVVSFFADNYGRKRALIVAWAICTAGSFLVVIGFHISIVTLGLFLSGFGADAANSLTFLFFCEVVNNKKRQKYSILMQIFFTIGALVATTLFYWINDWRIVWSLIVVAPALAQLIMLTCYIEETPHFLVKNGCSVALKALNRIGMINLDRRQTLEQEEIESVIDSQMMQQLQDVKITHLDLCRFTSLRSNTVFCSMIAFGVYGMYFAPVLLADSIGIDIYRTTYIVLGSQLIIYLPTYLTIEKIKRRYFGSTLLGVAVFCSLLLVVLYQQCQLCLQSGPEILLIVIFRAAVSFFFSFFEIYISEIFPSRVRGLSFGIISAIGSLSTILTPILLNILIEAGSSGIILFCMGGVLAAGGLLLLPETMGVPLQEQIQEVEMHRYRNTPEKCLYDPKKKWNSLVNYKKDLDQRMIQSHKL